MSWLYEHRPDAMHSKHVFTNPDTGEVVVMDDIGALYEGWLAQQAREADAVGDLTRAELVGALKVERERSQKAETELGKVVVSFRAANEAHNQMAAKYDALTAEVEKAKASHSAMASDVRPYINKVSRERDEARAEVERLQNESAGHTSDQCEADAIQAEYEALEAELRENLSLRDGVVTAWMGELGTTLVPAIAAVLQATEPLEARP